jgi:tRNA-dependent cyclodipeptide synthase
MSIYRVTVRKGLGNGDWKNYSKINFEVSLSNKRYQGESLFSIIEWAKSRFTDIEIILCDSLHRHNILFERNVSISEARNISLEMGNAWLNHAHIFFNALNVTPKITRWDDWIKKYENEYTSYYHEIETLYNENSYIKKEVDLLCNNYLKRNNNILCQKSFRQQILMPYFFEETALSSVFLPKIGGVNAYPGSLPQLWNYFINTKENHLSGFKNQLFISLNLSRK